MTIISLDKNQKKQIEEKLEELNDLCQILNVPMFATVVVDNNEDGTEYESSVYGSTSHNIQLTEDHIKRHILIANQFNTTKVTPPRENFSIDMNGL